MDNVYTLTALPGGLRRQEMSLSVGCGKKKNIINGGCVMHYKSVFIFMAFCIICVGAACAADFVTIQTGGHPSGNVTMERWTDGQLAWSSTTNVEGVVLLAVGPDGNVYGSTSLGDNARVWNGADGTYLGTVIDESQVPGGEIVRVYGICFGPDVDGDGIDDLYSFEGGSATSNYVHSWTSSSGYTQLGGYTVENKCTYAGAWAGDFGPDVSGDGQPDLFILDGTAQNSGNICTVVDGVDPTGDVLYTFSLSLCNRPGCLVAGLDGRIYVASRNNDRVVSYAADGTDGQIVVDLDGCNFPTQIDEGEPGQWYIANRFNVTGLPADAGSVVMSMDNFASTSILFAGTEADDLYGCIASFDGRDILSGYQAEEALSYGTEIIESVTASAGRCLDGFDAIGDYINYQDVESGNALEIRYSNALAATQCSVYVNGVDVATASFASTGSWSIFDTTTINDIVIPENVSVKLQIDADDHAFNNNGTCAIQDKIDITGPAIRAFIHPGITHKLSDLDRIKYMVEAQIDPWYSSYQEMAADSKSSYSYTVQGSSSFTELGRDSGVNYSAWKSDIRAAYYNAIRWYVTGDSRHADKAVEIFNAWSNLTSVTSGGTDALSGGVGYIMIEAAELIKSTYSGWLTSDINAFKEMLVYPGYSTSSEPSGDTTFYWMSYQGDPGRHGNQGLSGWRTVMAMGIFLDNEIMYDRALRHIKGLPHRPDDLAYPAGPRIRGSLISSTTYVDSYSTTSGSAIEDYGFNGVMTNYIWENGQCQESSRDQQHVFFGIGLICSMAEMAWNQGDDLYSHENDRLLLGLEYNMRYNVSYIESYPDQTSPWEPNVLNGEFIQRDDRTLRWFSKAISPDGRGGFSNVRPVFEMPVAHYLGRGFKTEEEAKWTLRARDKAIELSGYEVAGWTNDAIGWGALTARRPDYCYGDPISGFDSNNSPVYAMNVLPTTVEAENYDYFSVTGQDHTYHDTTPGNSGGEYRTAEDVDIETCSEGGYCIGAIENGEWLTYTVYVPIGGSHEITIRYAAVNGDGKVQFSFGGIDKTGEVSLPSTGGLDNWQDLTIPTIEGLSEGVQSMKVSFGDTSSAIWFNSMTISKTNCELAVTPSGRFISGINYSYYEGSWNSLPDFDTLTPVETGLASGINLSHAQSSDYYGFVFHGYFNVPTDGEYTFYTTSDDGSRLYVDGVKVVDNDGLHGVEEASGSLCLNAGYHYIRVEYFEKTGGNSLSAMYQGPGISKRTMTNIYADRYCGDVYTIYLDGDLNSDCFVNMDDFVSLAESWLAAYGLSDFARLSNDWSPGGYAY